VQCAASRPACATRIFAISVLIAAARLAGAPPYVSLGGRSGALQVLISESGGVSVGITDAFAARTLLPIERFRI
jgi:hypothetical protein